MPRTPSPQRLVDSHKPLHPRDKESWDATLTPRVDPVEGTHGTRAGHLFPVCPLPRGHHGQHARAGARVAGAVSPGCVTAGWHPTNTRLHTPPTEEVPLVTCPPSSSAGPGATWLERWTGHSAGLCVGRCPRSRVRIVLQARRSAPTARAGKPRSGSRAAGARSPAGTRPAAGETWATSLFSKDPSLPSLLSPALSWLLHDPWGHFEPMLTAHCSLPISKLTGAPRPMPEAAPPGHVPAALGLSAAHGSPTMRGSQHPAPGGASQACTALPSAVSHLTGICCGILPRVSCVHLQRPGPRGACVAVSQAARTGGPSECVAPDRKGSVSPRLGPTPPPAGPVQAALSCCTSCSLCLDAVPPPPSPLRSPPSAQGPLGQGSGAHLCPHPARWAWLPRGCTGRPCSWGSGSARGAREEPAEGRAVLCVSVTTTRSTRGGRRGQALACAGLSFLVLTGRSLGRQGTGRPSVCRLAAPVVLRDKLEPHS